MHDSGLSALVLRLVGRGNNATQWILGARSKQSKETNQNSMNVFSAKHLFRSATISTSSQCWKRDF